jgi:hypothetical protein
MPSLARKGINDKLVNDGCFHEVMAACYDGHILFAAHFICHWRCLSAARQHIAPYGPAGFEVDGADQIVAGTSDLLFSAIKQNTHFLEPPLPISIAFVRRVADRGDTKFRKVIWRLSFVELAFETVAHIGLCGAVSRRIGHADTRRLQLGERLHYPNIKVVSQQEVLCYRLASALKLRQLSSRD